MSYYESLTWIIMINHELSSNADLNEFPESIFCEVESVLLQFKKDPAGSQHTCNEIHGQFTMASYQRKKKTELGWQIILHHII